MNTMKNDEKLHVLNKKIQYLENQQRTSNKEIAEIKIKLTKLGIT